MSLVDVVPTLLDLLGVSPDADLDGMSLLEPPPEGPRPILFETTFARWAGSTRRFP